MCIIQYGIHVLHQKRRQITGYKIQILHNLKTYALSRCFWYFPCLMKGKISKIIINYEKRRYKTQIIRTLVTIVIASSKQLQSTVYL